MRDGDHNINMEATAAGDTADDDPAWTEIRVFTLNCWGLLGISKYRKERMAAIGSYLSRGEHDVVLLQEVWVEEDYETIKTLVSDTFPHSHFFDNGIIGSGTCVFSRVQIFDATFHEFGMNGYPHKVWHGDWFGGKGLGVCQILLKGFDVHVYTSHYHAEYDRKHDVYLGHRVLHALESAEWIRLSSSSADLTIYAGDFNTEPTDVPYKMLRTIAHLDDAWEDVHGASGDLGKTCGTDENSFSVPSYPGKRIDYIMHRAGPNVKSKVTMCELPLANRVPGKNYSFSDHEAVTATIRVRHDDRAPRIRVPELKRELSQMRRPECVQVVREALDIIKRSQNYIVKDKCAYGSLAGLFFVLFAATFIPPAIYSSEGWGARYTVSLDVALFLPRFLFTVAIVFFSLMASVFHRKERNALASAKKSLQLILNQDCSSGHPEKEPVT